MKDQFSKQGWKKLIMIAEENIFKNLTSGMLQKMFSWLVNKSY